MARFGRNKKSGKAELKPDGQVRQSQMVGSYGAGSMVDLLQHAVIVSGLENWRFEGLDDQRLFIEEPRLRDRLSERHADLDLGSDRYFVRPPYGDDSEASPSVGIKALEFPAWFVCQGCQRLLRRNDLPSATRKDARRYHECDRKKPSPVVPVRFVGACASGHLQDLPWVRVAHMGEETRCPAPELYLKEDPSGDFSKIRVRCDGCGTTKALASLMGKHSELICEGRRPWLPKDSEIEPCEERLRLLVRTASNSYFPLVMSALSVPDPDNQLFDEVSKYQSNFRGQSEKLMRMTLEETEKYQPLLERYGIERVFEAMNAVLEGRTNKRKAIRTAEYEQFLSAPFEQTGESYSEAESFVARATEVPTSLQPFLEKIVLVHRLREVRVQFGFTRLEPPTADNQGEFDELSIKRAPLSAGEKWLPATTVQGEGVFIQLSNKALDEWQQRSKVQARAKTLQEGFEKSLQGQKQNDRPFLGAKFYLLHSLAHVLINAISLECGYSASAIRERIYCGPYGDDPTEMAGILLYTGTVGSEGTLGGLVDQGKHIETHLRRAREMAALCSNDPVCASHVPSRDHAERFLEGAACHGCLFVAEPSCERFNRYLDRALLVPVVGGEQDTAFFPALNYV
ncbi:MAG: DUF1998 domain-containing protein [Myxococcales bacterium]|nr:MAG: DUF1998 domain-containing protein [Myxococcales bacterium]